MELRGDVITLKSALNPNFITSTSWWQIADKVVSCHED